jgi:ketosteroid isomerase-like protein
MKRNIEISTLSERLTILEEKESIRNVIYGYAYNVDSRSMEPLLELFHEDVIFNYPSQNVAYQGKLNIKPFFQGIFDTYDVIQHKIMNTMIQVDGHTASAKSYWMVYEIFTKGGERWGEGQYCQKFIRTADGWKIKEHTIDAIYFRVDKQDVFKGLYFQG